MAWFLVLWTLRNLCTLLFLLSSFKALRRPVARKRRPTLAGQDARRTTISPADRARRKGIKEQVTIWLVWVIMCALEKVVDRSVGWLVPFYDELKILALLSILAWRSAGAELVFRKLIKPVVSPYERPLDAIGFVADQLLSWALAMMLFAPRWIRERYIRSREEDVPSIMRALRAPGRPPVAHTVATSLATAQVHARAAPPPPTAALAPPIAAHPRRAPTTATALLPPRPLPSEALHLPRPASSSNGRRTISGGSTTTRRDGRSTKVNGPVSIYPALPVAQPLVAEETAPLEDVWTPTNFRSSVVAGHKGKERDRAEPSPPRPPRASVPQAQNASHPQPILFGAAGPSTPSAFAIHVPVPHEKSPPRPRSTSTSPPRASSSVPLPTTPAPPGAFLSRPSSSAASAYITGPRGALLREEESAATAAASPRQKALNAIAGLSLSLEGDSGMAWGRVRRDGEGKIETGTGAATGAAVGAGRKRTRGTAEVGIVVGSPGKRAKLALPARDVADRRSNGKSGEVDRARLKRKVVVDDEAEWDGAHADDNEDEDDGDDGTETATEKGKGKGKSKVPARTRTNKPAGVTGSASTTSIPRPRSRAQPQIVPPLRSHSSSTEDLSLPLRPRLPDPTSANTRPIPTVRGTSTQGASGTLPDPRRAPVARGTATQSARGTLPDPTRKAATASRVRGTGTQGAIAPKKPRRVLLGTNGAGESDAEEDGVPVVKRRKAR